MTWQGVLACAGVYVAMGAMLLRVLTWYEAREQPDPGRWAPTSTLLLVAALWPLYAVALVAALVVGGYLRLLAWWIRR